MLFCWVWARASCSLALKGPVHETLSTPLEGAGQAISYSFKADNRDQLEMVQQSCKVSFVNKYDFSQEVVHFDLDYKEEHDIVQHAVNRLVSTVVASTFFGSKVFLLTFKGSLFAYNVSLKSDKYLTLERVAELSRLHKKADMFFIDRDILLIVEKESRAIYAFNISSKSLTQIQSPGQVSGSIVESMHIQNRLFLATVEQVYSCPINHIKLDLGECHLQLSFTGQIIRDLQFRNLSGESFLFILLNSELRILPLLNLQQHSHIHGDFSSFEVGQRVIQNKVAILLQQETPEVLSVKVKVTLSQLRQGNQLLKQAHRMPPVRRAKSFDSHWFYEYESASQIKYNSEIEHGLTDSNDKLALPRQESIEVYIQKITLNLKFLQLVEVSYNKMAVTFWRIDQSRLECTFNGSLYLPELTLTLCNVSRNDQVSCSTSSLFLDIYDSQAVNYLYYILLGLFAAWVQFCCLFTFCFVAKRKKLEIQTVLARLRGNMDKGEGRMELADQTLQNEQIQNQLNDTVTL